MQVSSEMGQCETVGWVQVYTSLIQVWVLYIWVFPENRGTPKSSILIGFSIINHPFWGTPIFGNTHFPSTAPLFQRLNFRACQLEALRVEAWNPPGHWVHRRWFWHIWVNTSHLYIVTWPKWVAAIRFTMLECTVIVSHVYFVFLPNYVKHRHEVHDGADTTSWIGRAACGKVAVFFPWPRQYFNTHQSKDIYRIYLPASKSGQIKLYQVLFPTMK